MKFPGILDIFLLTLGTVSSLYTEALIPAGDAQLTSIRAPININDVIARENWDKRQRVDPRAKNSISYMINFAAFGIIVCLSHCYANLTLWHIVCHMVMPIWHCDTLFVTLLCQSDIVTHCLSHCYANLTLWHIDCHIVMPIWHLIFILFYNYSKFHVKFNLKVFFIKFDF